MVIGTLQFELIIHQSENLKDKRRVVQSVKDRLWRRYRVAVAETGALEHHRIALMGVAAVSNSTRHAGAVLDKVVRALRDEREAELGDCTRQIMSAAPTAVRDLDDPILEADEQNAMIEDAERYMQTLDDGEDAP